MPSDDQLQAAVERITAALRERLERDLSAVADELRRIAVEERERSARTAAEVGALKRALNEARERAAQQEAESAAADMRREAEMQAHVARIHEDARHHIEEVQRAAAEERHRAVQQASEAAAAEARRQADGQIAQLRDAAQTHAEEIRRAAEAQVGELRATLQAQLDEVRRAAHAQTEEVRRTAHIEIEDARRVAAAQVDDVQRRADAQIGEIRRNLESQIEETRRWAHAEVEQGHAAIESARAEADAASRIARAEADAATRAARAEAEEVVIAQLASAQAEAERKIQQAIDATRTDAHQAELAYTARVVDAIRRIDDARSVGEALDALADCAARQVERAAVLVVKHDKLRLRRLAGFAAAPPASDMDLDSAGLAGAVVNTGVTVSRAAVQSADAEASRQPALPPFAEDVGARYAVALPVIVGGRVVAVLYADSPSSDAPSAASRWPATLEVLARHASRTLEALTVQHATGLSLPRPASRPTRSTVPGPLEHGGTGDEDAARRFARLLVSEIRMYHEPLVNAGRRSRDLRTRLGGEIDRARRLYEERVPPTVRDRSDYFEQELVRTLADGDRSLLG